MTTASKPRTAAQARSVLLKSIADLVKSVSRHLEEMDRRVRSEDLASPLADFTQFGDAVHAILEAEPIPVLGMGFIAAPAEGQNTLIRWWYKGAKNRASMRPLAAATQPLAMDFYDVTTTEWWQLAVESKRPVTSGPYVDVSGTNAYVVTFSLAVRSGEKVLGVVAVDVAVGVLQATWQNALLDLPRPTSIVDRQGMVIATNAGALLGSVLDLDHSSGARRQNVSGTSWMLIEGPTSAS